MSRLRLRAVCVVGIASVVTFWAVWSYRNASTRSRQIATSLLEFNHWYVTNGNHTPNSMAELPDGLQDTSLDGYVVGNNNVFVIYRYRKLGVEWSRSFRISRTNAEDLTWTIVDCRYLEHPRVPWPFWKQKSTLRDSP